jgi:hypothetical protein
VPFRGLNRMLLEAAAELRARGFASVLAHPPRRSYTLEQGRRLAVELGATEAEADRLVDGGPLALLERGLSF